MFLLDKASKHLNQASKNTVRNFKFMSASSMKEIENKFKKLKNTY